MESDHHVAFGDIGVDTQFTAVGRDMEKKTWGFGAALL